MIGKKINHAQFSSARLARILVCLVVSGLLVGCGVDGNDGDIVNTLPVPTDLTLNLQCPDVGINTEACILDDPENPYARADVSDSTKFELAEDTPSAKASFYLWGTALARSAQGENQYYTARALHQMYTEGGSEVARTQAIRAYRSVLDNFFDSFTYFKVELAEGEVFISLVLSELTGESLYDPLELNLTPLYNNKLQALDAMGSWGYNYDVDSGVVTRNF